MEPKKTESTLEALPELTVTAEMMAAGAAQLRQLIGGASLEFAVDQIYRAMEYGRRFGKVSDGRVASVFEPDSESVCSLGTDLSGRIRLPSK